MDELVAFLRAALDDDERVAKACLAGAPGPWTFDGEVVRDAEGSEVAGQLRWGMEVMPDEDGAHIARWDPARVLAEIEAKRRILALWEDAMEPYGAGAAQEAIEALARPYSDRPGFKDEWRLT